MKVGVDIRSLIYSRGGLPGSLPWWLSFGGQWVVGWTTISRQWLDGLALVVGRRRLVLTGARRGIGRNEAEIATGDQIGNNDVQARGKTGV